ncbi:DNA-processing protein DprA [Radiobacillus sp. PE A8.2]|uniref:DNA-processing protein DprA n=1 Tax=Radiobacillus sp. PE A8.2 TaxID=3380349 RepID=UPI00388EE492
MLKKDPTLESIYPLSAANLAQTFSLKQSRAATIYHDWHHVSTSKSLENDLQCYDILTIFDHNYPPMLKMIQDPPLILYLLGNRNLLNHLPSLSVVGTRNPTREAKRKMDYILQPLVKKDWLFVSGMARGIDTYAHQLALNNNGKTIAVLGGGFDHIYPKENEHLFSVLANAQLVISEYPPHIPPQRYHFPERNRIISGLSFGTIVIEAKERSGSLITVDQALDQGKQVFAVPGSPYIAQTTGCHKMIQDGAKLVINTYDLEEEWEQEQLKWCRN